MGNQQACYLLPRVLHDHDEDDDYVVDDDDDDDNEAMITVFKTNSCPLAK